MKTDLNLSDRYGQRNTQKQLLTTTRPRAKLLWVSLLFLLLGLSAVGEFIRPYVRSEYIDVSIVYFYLLLLAVVCFIPVFVSYHRYGNAGIFEPVQAAAAATLFYVCFQVSVRIQQDTFRYYDGTNLIALVPKLISFSALALICFYIGYYGVGRPKDLNPNTLVERPRSIEVKAITYIVIGIVLLELLLWIEVGQIPISSLWAIGDARYLDWHGSQGTLVGFLVGARASLAACTILLLGTRLKPRWGISQLVIVILPFVFLSAMGSRTLALNVIIGAFMYYLLEQRKNVKLTTIILVIAIGFIYIGIIGYYRLGSNLLTDQINLTTVYDSTVNSSGIALTSALVLDLVPNRIGYLFGQSYLSAIVGLIPTIIWPGKVAVMSSLISNNSFRDIYTYMGSAWFSWVELYRNFGMIGIVGGMYVLGWISGKIQVYYLRNRHNLFAQSYLILYWLYLFTTYSRPGPAEATIRLFLFFWPVVVVHLAWRFWFKTKIFQES